MSALIDLACAFPPRLGLRGACTSIRNLSRHGMHDADTVFVRTKQDAVRLIWRASEERFQSDGAGNKAKRRAKSLTK